jgi:D-arginine dehydrogenase
VDTLPDRAAVVIVGGGLAGAATAWALAQRGVRDVTVLEREDLLGLHASGRNAGMCRQIAEDDRWTSLCARGARFLRQPPDGFAPRPLMEVTGSLLLGDDDATVASLSLLASKHGIAHAIVSADEVARRVPAAAGLRCAGAVHTVDDGIIDTTTLLHAFAEGARRAGARVVLRADVHALQPPASVGGDVAVVTSRGTVRTPRLVVASGAWAGVIGALAGARDLDFAPIKRHLFFLAQDAGGPALGEPYVWRVGPSEVYVRNGADGLIASACDATRTPPGDVRIDRSAADDLVARLAEAPALQGRAITATWACQRTFSPEGHPRIGRDPELPWLFWVAGLGGHGATSCAAIGDEAASLIA